MKRWFRRIALAAASSAIVAGALVEVFTYVGRGWLFNEPFYDGRPASYWADQVEHWETQDPEWDTQTYVRRPIWPRWAERMLPEPRWPALLDGDPDGLAVLQALAKYSSVDVQDWARIGIERIDNGERGPYKIKHPSVIMTAELFEIDDAYYQKVAKDSRWRSLVELEKLEQMFLTAPVKDPQAESLFDPLEKLKPLMSAKDIKIDANKEGVLLSSTKEIQCLPSPGQLRKGQTLPQKIETGVVLRAHVEISSDRRYVRVKFIEKISELQGIEKITAPLDDKGAQGKAELVFMKESTFALPRTIPDGATVLLALQYRPTAGKDNGRRLVVRIDTRIYLEAEQRQIRVPK